MNKVKDQLHEENYSLYNSDCMLVLPTLKDESIDLSIYSPPFADLYKFSSSPNDMSNVSSNDEFIEQYEFLVKELSRVTKKGRINAIHCTDLFKYNGALSDFPAEIIKLHEKHGFTYMSRITIWKEPLRVRLKTMVQSLMHKFIVEDSTKNYPAMPDYILLFKKKGENKIPVTHPFGFTHYAGTTPILTETVGIYNRANGTEFQNGEELWNYICKKYENHEEPTTNKKSHIIWQRYASAVWDDIRAENCLPFKDSKEEDDEKHVTPTQLDVLDRIVDLYSNPNEIVLSPFMGVGSDVYSPVSQGRKAIGIELKDSYYKQAILNCKEAEKRFNEKNIKQPTLFDMLD
jgi:DNA modification methylase